MSKASELHGIKQDGHSVLKEENSIISFFKFTQDERSARSSTGLE